MLEAAGSRFRLSQALVRLQKQPGNWTDASLRLWMLQYADSLMQNLSPFPHLSLAWLKRICSLLLLEGREFYGKNMPFVQPKGRDFSSSRLWKLFPNFIIWKSFGEVLSSFSNKTVRDRWRTKFISVALKPFHASVDTRIRVLTIISGSPKLNPMTEPSFGALPPWFLFNELSLSGWFSQCQLVEGNTGRPGLRLHPTNIYVRSTCFKLAILKLKPIQGHCWNWEDRF